MMKLKNNYIFYMVGLVILIAAVLLFFKINRLKYLLSQSSSKIKEMNLNLELTSNFIGRVFSLDKTMNLYNGNNYNKNSSSKPDFVLFFVVGKVTCKPCVDDFMSFFSQLPKEKIECAIIVGSDKESVLYELAYWNKEFQVFYTDKLDWFEKYDVVSGPAIFIVERDTQKIVAFYKKTEQDRWGFEERIKATILKYAEDK